MPIHPAQSDAGRCQQPDDAGLIVSFDISGGSQRYCLCDTGLCATQSLTATTVLGDYVRTISWDGRNWQGPSDTGNPEGAPFPVGSYTLTLTASGTYQEYPDASSDSTFTITATRPIIITP
jgi:hypothetical protein